MPCMVVTQDTKVGKKKADKLSVQGVYMGVDGNTETRKQIFHIILNRDKRDESRVT